MPDTGTSEYGEVLDTKIMFWDTLRKKTDKLLIFFLLSLVWSSACVILSEGILYSEFWILVLLLPWLLILVWLAYIYIEIREAFWRQLALKYHWEYTLSKNLTKEKALLFKQGHTPLVYHGISGSYNNQPFHIFEYQYTVGSGKHQTTYSFTVFEVKFTGTFPHLYLNHRGDWYSNTPSMFSSLAQISVPKEFADRFKLYAPKEYEIETLEIFTPEIFALLLDLKWNHDMEFVDGELVIYRRVTFSSFTKLDAELGKIKKFVDILSPRLNRLKLEKVGDISPSLRS